MNNYWANYWHKSRFSVKCSRALNKEIIRFPQPCKKKNQQDPKIGDFSVKAKRNQSRKKKETSFILLENVKNVETFICMMTKQKKSLYLMSSSVSVTQV